MRAGLGQRLLDAHAPEPLLHVGQRFLVREVRDRDDPLGRTAADPPGAVVVAPHDEALFLGPVDDERRRLGLDVARLVDERARAGRAARSSPWCATAEMHRPSYSMGRDVGLGADDDARAVEQLGPVAPQLVEQDALLLLRAALVHRREVEQHHEHAGPLDVAEELVAEARALGRALDQPGEVGDARTRGPGTARRRGSARAW